MDLNGQSIEVAARSQATQTIRHSALLGVASSKDESIATINHNFGKMLSTPAGYTQAIQLSIRINEQ